MLKFESIVEILRFARAKEQSSCQFYKDLSQTVSNPVSQGVFSALANEEERHAASIEMEIYKLGHTVKPEKADEGGAEERLSVDEEAKNMGFLDAIEMAIEKERAAFRLYAELMGQTQEGEARQIFAELAEEEVRHMIRLEKEYEYFSSHRTPQD